MIALLLAAAVHCASSPAQLLDANRLAMGRRANAGTVIQRYTYVGQGLEGRATTRFDLQTGRFEDEVNAPPIDDIDGFDGRRAWYRDLSGAFLPQDAGGRRGIAVSETYLNAQAWWRKDRGGARLQLTGCNTLKVTPRGGNSFAAEFDPATKLLTRIRQTLTFGTTQETRYLDYERRGALLAPTRIETVINDDPSTQATMRLTSLNVAAVQPSSKYSMAEARPSDWVLPPSGTVTVPFQLLNNHVILDAKVNGKGPFPFLLDSGGHDIVTPATLSALRLSSRGESASGGAGEGKATNGYTRVDSIDVGGAVLTGQTVVTLDFSPLAVEGIQLGGMLGLEFIERFIVRIDYGRRTITIMDPRKFGTAERRSSGTAVPFVFYEHMPQVSGTFDGRRARFNIDTGSRSDVTMTRPFVEDQNLREAYPNGISATEGWGVGGPSKAYLVRAGSLTLGTVRVPGPIAGLSSARKGAFSDSMYDGNVGSGALKRFVVTLDYPDRTIFLKPNSRLDPDTGQFDRSGMWINLASEGLKVMDVAKGGPADLAGLKIGDLITNIGGQPVVKRSLSDVRSSLKTAAVGQPLTIEYSRSGQEAAVKLVPRKLIEDKALSN
ncbi:MAG TPA: aspartyl protease family protein [Sphingomicrobium sp.]|nr:aspartyl protease family protein [Sphingomicrobium sp.]